MRKRILVFVFTLLYVGAIHGDINADISRVHDLCNEENFGEALPIMQAVVNEIAADRGNNSITLVVPYHNKGIIERELGLYSASKASLEEGIRIIVSHRGPYHPSLVGPLIELGVLHYMVGDDVSAMEKFREAQHISHRNDGVYTLNQLSAMDWISATVKRSSTVEVADVQERFYYKINEKNYSEGDMRLLPAMERFGGWLKSTGQFSDAMRVQERALVLVKGAGEDHIYETVPILREMASVAYLSGKCCWDKPLKEVMGVMQGGHGGDVEELIKATLHLADMKMLYKRIPEAGDLYKKAWELRSGTPKAEEYSQREFGQPILLGYKSIMDGVYAYDDAVSSRSTDRSVVIYRPAAESQTSVFSFGLIPEKAPQKLIGSPLLMCFRQVQEFLPRGGTEHLDDYYMDLDFSVKNNGSVSMVKVKDNNTPGKLVRYVKKVLKILRFRPKIENGAAVPSHVSVRQTFRDVDLNKVNNASPFPDRVSGAAQVCKILAFSR